MARRHLAKHAAEVTTAHLADLFIREPLLDHLADDRKIETELLALPRLIGALASTAAADPALLATDLADYLVLRGLPFRQAHEVIGKLVAYSLAQKRGFAELDLS